MESAVPRGPLFPEASGQIVVGQRITLKSVHPANGRMMTVKPKITVAEAGAELRWTASLPGIISGEHSFVFSPVSEGTRLTQSESLRGLLVPLSGRTITRSQASFAALNEALRKRAEAS
jgi:hypothetical protein